MKKGNIIIIDDLYENLILLEKIIISNTDYEVHKYLNGLKFLEDMETGIIIPDILLLDIMMPDIDGFSIAAKLREMDKNIPIIYITALSDIDNKVKAFENGGVDYVSKPFNRLELLARINNQMNLKKLRDELEFKNKELEIKNNLLADSEKNLSSLVEEKTKKIETITLTLVSLLENTNAYKDEDTGNHIKRVASYSALLAWKYGCDKEYVRKIEMYSPLHDIGKIGIPDEILKKPDRLTEEEREIMKLHTIIGGEILKEGEVDDVAKNIVISHHEKWDGTGYPFGLIGEEIPLEGRIVALADVFDALISKRVYKPPFSQDDAEKIIIESKGTFFEPKLVDVFFENIEQIKKIRNKFR